MKKYALFLLIFSSCTYGMEEKKLLIEELAKIEAGLDMLSFVIGDLEIVQAETENPEAKKRTLTSLDKKKHPKNSIGCVCNVKTGDMCCACWEKALWREEVEINKTAARLECSEIMQSAEIKAGHDVNAVWMYPESYATSGLFIGMAKPIPNSHTITSWYPVDSRGCTLDDQHRETARVARWLNEQEERKKAVIDELLAKEERREELKILLLKKGQRIEELCAQLKSALQ